MLLKIKRVIDTMVNGVIVVMLFCMFIVVLIQVFTRFVLNNPLSWTEEIARYLMVWMGFLGTAVGLKYGLHMSLDIITNKTTGNFKLILHLVGNLLTLIIGLLFLIYGYRLMLQGRNRLSMALQFKMEYVFLAFPVSGVLIIVNSIESMLVTLGILQDPSQENE
jgi:TRAP-type C4-dicarboxylate transport system permease small subunit